MTQDEAERLLTSTLEELELGGWQVSDSADIENDGDDDALEVATAVHCSLFLRPTDK